MSVVFGSLDGVSRGLRRAVARAGKALGGSPVTARAARSYVRALLPALEEDPALAARLLDAYDDRVPSDLYAAAFESGDLRRLAELARRDEQATLTVVFAMATRLRLDEVRSQAQLRLAGLLGRKGEADRLVSRLQRWQDAGLLDPATPARALTAHLAGTPLERDPALWTGYFAQLPESLLPDLFEVRCFLGRGAEAVRLADTPDRRTKALACCARSPRLADAKAGLELAGRLGDEESARGLEVRLGELLLAAGQYAEALPRFGRAGRPDLESTCLERLGRFAEALAACPGGRPDRLARLAGLCRPQLDELVEQGDFTAAVRQTGDVAGHLDRAEPATDALTERRAELTGLRAAVLAAGRRHFGARTGGTDQEERTALLTEWSRFEEYAGEQDRAARLAEEAGDVYRAHRLYRAAARFGDAERVLRAEDTDEGRTARAEAREAGGDLVGAARLRQAAGRHDEATALFMRAGDFAAAAGCLTRWRGDDAAEDPRLAECLRRAGEVEELAHRLLRVVGRAGEPSARIIEELRRLRDEAVLSPVSASQVTAALGVLDARGRQPFEDRAAEWVRRARSDIDRRFAGVWGLDLGTTTSTAAVYDTELGRPVLCPWKGHDQFASTLSLDAEGNELIGLAGEEIFANRLLGHIGSAKRKIGSTSVFRVRDRTYRPEEVAARLIGHARGLVEDLLADRVRERVAELARAELGAVRSEWLSWLGDHHDLRLSRPRALLTIPAYFRNNQKHATRNACEIAGVEPVRLIHEPTAACMAAARERGLSGGVVVVDLGAGTLDVSFLEVGDAVYQVRQVLGDNDYGGNDFDEVICRELARRLGREGITVPPAGLARRRLQVAAEYLKTAVSSQEQNDYPLPHFVDGRDVTVSLSRTELAGLLEPSLTTLRDTCAKFAAALGHTPDHLVLVGGPMLSPTVRTVVEEAFGLTRTVIRDPRSAVACGAALQAAVLDRKLEDVLLLDVTPLPMGIKVDDDGRPRFSELIAAHTTIPTQARESYTTTRDNQTAVSIEIYNGSLSPQAKVGQFQLVDLPPAPQGTPEIEVRFAIDPSCVLEVTARDKKTGKSNSVRISDTTLLSPRELDAMTRRHEQQGEAREIRGRLSELAGQAAGTEPEAQWREFRNRLAAHRPPPGPLDKETERVLLEIFNESGETETELTLAGGPLRDLAEKARAYLALPDAEAHLEEGRYLEQRLRERLQELEAHLARVTRWSGVLDALAATEADPLLRFRHLHDTGSYARALEALSELPRPPGTAEDVHRRLRCLAETGDVEAYRQALLGEAQGLGVAVADGNGPAAFLARARGAFAGVTVRTAGGAPAVRGSGFLISDRLVVTNRHWLAGPSGPARGTADPRTPVAASRVEVVLGTRSHPVRHIHLPDSPHPDLALLRLAEPAGQTPLRLGHSTLVRVGDLVRTPEPPEWDTLGEGTVDGFESFPEQGLHLYRTGLRAGPRSSGGPLLNTLGEVVGVLVLGGDPEQGAFALTVDSLAPLLAAAGFGVDGEADG